LEERNKIFFASDFHLGAPNRELSLARERKLVNWLNAVSHEAKAIYLLGDLFDFWFEYKRAVPRGFTRVLGTIAEITDSGIPVHLFTGNHDMWIFDYLPEECGVILHREPVVVEWDQKKIMIGHGDGLGPGDHGYKFIKKIFRSKLCQWLFARLHPNLGIAIASSLSKYSRSATGESDLVFLGNEKEWLVQYCLEELKKNKIDYFIFGHRHLPLSIALLGGASYINLGEWITDPHYAIFHDGKLELLKLDTPSFSEAN
jgi:UDP-2,3-diacylglucosamine hydrolase